MTILENLYNDNIDPCDAENLKNNPKYKQGISLVAQAQEKLIVTLSEEQKKLSYNYLTNAEKLSIVINEEIFKIVYALTTKIMIEIEGI